MDKIIQWFASIEWKHGFTQYGVAIDQLLNVVLGNPFSKDTWADESISSRCGRKSSVYPYKIYRPIIDAIFRPFQGPDHCANAYKKELTRYQFPPSMRDANNQPNKKA